MSLTDTMTRLMSDARKHFEVGNKLSIGELIHLFEPNPNLYVGTKDMSGNFGYHIGADSYHPGDCGWYKDGMINGLQIVSQFNNKWGGLYQYVNAKVGETYTYSFWAKSSKINPSATINFDDGTSHNVRITLTTAWKRYSTTVTITKDQKIDPRINTNISDSVMSIYGMKLEKGNIATPWCPAAADKVGGGS